MEKVKMPERNLNIIILNPFFLLFLALIVAGSSCGDNYPVKTGKTSRDVPDQVLIRPKIFISENGKTTAILESNVVKIYAGGDSSYASLEDSIRISFFNNEGKHTSTLTALSGEIWGMYEDTDSLKAQGDVFVVSEERNASLKAPSIRWIASAQKIFGEGVVTIQSENGFEQGTGFIAKDDLTEYEFTGPVSGEVKGEDVKLPRR